ncbi:MAG: hypothetical protein FJ164_06025 [Gammaproteobacteria bacterium]|nr:hypothetical protein [Gammaproteobacteria bacterium]
MDSHGIDWHVVDWQAVAWFAGWLLALASLWVLAVRLPLLWRQGRSFRQQGLMLLAALAVVLFANITLSLHDTQFDLTRGRIFTPAPEALAVVRALDRPVTLTFFHRDDDPDGLRVVKVLKALARHNDKLEVRAVDPDREPALAASLGVRVHNIAVVEAEGRRVTVEGTDDREFALGIQRVLRARSETVCFAEGLGEDASENGEFITHQDAPAGHDHNDPQTRLVVTSDRGYVRLRRALEAQGHTVETVMLANGSGIPVRCRVLIHAGPRKAYPPEVVQTLRAYLHTGGAALLMYDLGFEPGPSLTALLGELGIHLPPAAVREPSNHLEGKPGTLAVTGYVQHPITARISLTMYPGIRPLQLMAPAPGLEVQALIESTQRAALEAVDAGAGEAAQNLANNSANNPAQDSADGGLTPPFVLGAVVEGALPGADESLRAVVVGDADFARNSLLPYAANGDLVLAMVRWLLRQEAEPAVAARIPTPSPMILSPAAQRLVFVVVEILLPLLAAVIGFFLWWRRR